LTAVSVTNKDTQFIYICLNKMIFISCLFYDLPSEWAHPSWVTDLKGDNNIFPVN